MDQVKLSRPTELQNLINLLKHYFAQTTVGNSSAQSLFFDIFSALDDKVGNINFKENTQRMPASQYFQATIDNLYQGPELVKPFAAVLTALAPLLVWHKRTPANNLLGNEDQNIANCLLIGSNGIEQRNDLQMGMTIMAPNTLFNDHSHPPDEIYAILSSGHWRQNNDQWHEPGMGGLVYNPHNIIHAFKSSQVPLLTIWCLGSTENKALQGKPYR